MARLPRHKLDPDAGSRSAGKQSAALQRTDLNWRCRRIEIGRRSGNGLSGGGMGVAQPPGGRHTYNGEWGGVRVVDRTAGDTGKSRDAGCTPRV